MTIKAVVFDVDGVLVEAFVWARILAERHGLDRSRTDPFFLGPFKQCLLGRARLKAELEPFIAAWRWPGSVDDFVAGWFEADSAVNQHAVAVVGELRGLGYRCYVGSTQEAERVAWLRRALRLEDRFDGAFFSCELGVQKPDPGFFEQATRAIGIDPAEILFLDDHPANVDGARGSGWRASLCRIGDDLRGVVREHGIEIPAARAGSGPESGPPRGMDSSGTDDPPGHRESIAP